ncbi:MAG TPA: hypothetical protein VNY52_00985 [Solirubrobacteraceae bacterium]|jgi:hypothetical protein|nr:hypothetical protein [Solirubrobacteraceae bacterium]
MMRRASTLGLLLGLGLLAGMPVAASATPVVTLKAAAVPLKGYPGTGDILGAGTALEVEFTIKGTEVSGDAPSQLRGVNFFAPAGAKLHTQGFVTCTEAILRNSGPEGCPKKSQASPVGTAVASDTIAGEPIREKATVQAFFAPGGGLLFYGNAPSPISAQVYVPGKIMPVGSPFSYEVTTEIEEIASVPGAPNVSTEAINLKVGAAYRKHGKPVYYATVPKKCPKGGFPFKAELKFQNGEVVTKAYNAPCPKHKK